MADLTLYNGRGRETVGHASLFLMAKRLPIERSNCVGTTGSLEHGPTQCRVTRMQVQCACVMKFEKAPWGLPCSLSSTSQVEISNIVVRGSVPILSRRILIETVGTFTPQTLSHRFTV